MSEGVRLAPMPALDGLRGLAVAAVLAFHLGYLPGGFLGVDLFFVLSGFLITSLLLAEHRQRGTIALGRFWARRARRLLPALLVVLAAIAAYTWVAADPAELDRIRGDALATLGYVANWREIFAGRSYWDLFGQPSPLEHTWSLAIEEQFYFVWPLLVAGVLALTRGSQRVLLGVTAGLAAASAAAMLLLYQPFADPSRVYFGTDTRAASILIGAVLAIAGRWVPTHARQPSSRAVDAIGGLGFAATGVVWFIATGASGWLYRGGFIGLELAAALVIWAVARPNPGHLGRLLSIEPLRALGLISYGLYLWHWPVFIALTSERTGLDGPPLAGLRVAVSVVLAVASYRLVEQPLRQAALPGWRIRALTPAAVATTVVLVVVATIGSTNADPTLASTPVAALDPHPVGGVSPDRPTRVLVAGDSTALVLGHRFPAADHPRLAVTMAAGLGCGLARGQAVSGDRVIDSECGATMTGYRDALAAGRPAVVVLMAGAWEVLDRRVDGAVVRFGSPDWEANVREGLAAYVHPAAAAGARVVILTAPCFSELPDPRFPTSDRNDPARVAAYNRLAGEVAAANGPVASVIDYGARVCAGGRPTADLGDGVHLTPDGVARTWQWLEPLLL